MVTAYPLLSLPDRRALLEKVANRLDPSVLLLTLSDLETDRETRAATVRWLVPRAFRTGERIEVVIGRHRLLASPDHIAVEVRSPRLFVSAEAVRDDEVALGSVLDALAATLVRYRRQHGELPKEARPFASLFWVTPSVD